MSPESAEQLAAAMAMNNARGEKIQAIDLRRLNRVLELTPEDMTVTVESGISLSALQGKLAEHKQWLPIDPPNPEDHSIHDVLAKDMNGPRRYGFGTIREHVIGLKVVLADGRTIKSGGKVVKNVAGYDLAKLFIGARDSLGIIVEATFKVRPLPEMEKILAMESDLARAGDVLRRVLDSDLTPVVLDLYRFSNAAKPFLVLGLAGTRAEVESQLDLARSIGFVRDTTLGYDAMWGDPTLPVNRLSVLPSRVVEAIETLGPVPFVARAGNGVIYFRGHVATRKNHLPVELMRRVKTAYDPQNILPEFTL